MGEQTVTGTVVQNVSRAQASGARGSMMVTTAAETGSFAVGQLVLLHQTLGGATGVWEFARIGAVGTHALTLTTALANAYTSSGTARAQVMMVPERTNFTVTGTGTMSAPPWDGTTGGILALWATGTLTVQPGGRISATGRGLRGASGHCSVACDQGTAGEGLGGAATGGGAGMGVAGGAGGNGAMMTGAAGRTGGTFSCTPHAGQPGPFVGSNPDHLLFGSAGGEGGGIHDWHTGAGGDGGGLVFLRAGSIVLSGAVESSGASGQPFSNCGASNPYGAGAGGGGGGGLVRLEAVSTVSLGSGLVAATGGTGGGPLAGVGGSGIIMVRATTISGTSTPPFARL
jgi:hypothetical protein